MLSLKLLLLLAVCHHNKGEEAMEVVEHGIVKGGKAHQALMSLQKNEFDRMLKDRKPGKPSAVLSPSAEADGPDAQTTEGKEMKLRIGVEKSRVVYCVSDPSEMLLYGECFFQPTIDGAPRVLTGDRVVMVRAPTTILYVKPCLRHGSSRCRCIG